MRVSVQKRGIQHGAGTKIRQYTQEQRSGQYQHMETKGEPETGQRETHGAALKAEQEMIRATKLEMGRETERAAGRETVRGKARGGTQTGNYRGWSCGNFLRKLKIPA